MVTPNRLLFHKLLALGLPPLFVCWTLFRDARSRLFRIRRGVLQGSVHGPAHGRRQRGAGGVRGLPWIFIHGTDIVDKGLIVLFFDVFCYCSVFFPLAPLEFFLPTPLARPSSFWCAVHIDQKVFDHLKEWSLKWRLPVHPANVTAASSKWTPPASHQSLHTLTGTPLSYNPDAKFHGVMTIGRTLSFCSFSQLSLLPDFLDFHRGTGPLWSCPLLTVPISLP